MFLNHGQDYSKFGALLRYRVLVWFLERGSEIRESPERVRTLHSTTEDVINT